MKKEITFTAKIDIPEGYEAFYNEETKSVEIRKINILPNNWEEFCKQNVIKENEYFIDASSNIRKCESVGHCRYLSIDKNLLPNKEMAEAFLALMQLIQLRDVYRQGWKPGWEDGNTLKHCITISKEEIQVNTYFHANIILSFQSEEIRDKFLNNFRDLIEQAKELL